MSENGEIYTAGKNFTLPDFQAKNFTPSISPNFNSLSYKQTQKMSENGEIYTAG